MAEIELRSEMTGVVIKVLVEVGDMVAAEQAVIVIESMKMEIEITAPRRGRVSAIRVQVGDSISEGDPALTLHAD